MSIFPEMNIEMMTDSPFSEEEAEGFELDTPAFEDDEQKPTSVPVSAAPAVREQAGRQDCTAEPPAVQGEEVDAEDDDAKRKAHEEAEAQRKAEWEAKQQAKKAAEQEQLAKLEHMTVDELMSASVRRIGDDTEKLTRRNMKECVAEYIQTMCLEDPTFARKVMHPRKSMIHCVWYINRKAQEYAEQELKNNAMKPERNGIYGTDVPDDLCYQWAVDYFCDLGAKEDQEEEEKFIPKPYVGKAGGKSKTKTKPAKSAAAPKREKKPAPSKQESDQITLGGFGLPMEKAG